MTDTPAPALSPVEDTVAAVLDLSFANTAPTEWDDYQWLAFCNALNTRPTPSEPASVDREADEHCGGCDDTGVLRLVTGRVEHCCCAAGEAITREA